MLLLALASHADDRAPCERALKTPRWQSGVFVFARPDCKREAADLADGADGRLCRQARMTLQLPEPFDPDRVFVHLSEPREYSRVNQEGRTERQSLTIHNAWIEPGAMMQFRTLGGQRVRAQVLERAQADDMAMYEGVFWKVRVRLAEADLRKLRQEGLDGWSFEVNGQRFTHFVKKAKRFDPAVDCVLDGVLP